MNHLGTRTLITNQLILRRFVLGDTHQMFNNWGKDELTSRHLSWKAHSNEEETKEILGIWVDDYNKLDNYNWAVELKETNEIVVLQF